MPFFITLIKDTVAIGDWLRVRLDLCLAFADSSEPSQFNRVP